ncbi:DUF5723 family protein [Aliifodinibius sp. S!AR15-10]|nr:DUF5723 family protein [Aliifodinibius sp. S!AR15-10]
MGGGGTAYITGYEANFINPANLKIRDRGTNFSFGIGGAGTFYTPAMPTDNITDQFNHYRDYLDAYQPGAFTISSQEKQELLERNYPNKRQLSEHQHRVDAILGGVHWQRGDHAFSLTARARTSTRIEVGRGWYDDRFIEHRSTSVRNMDLVQQSQFMYEFSFGYAQTFDFLTGLIPRVGRVYIGLAPKFIIGGSYQNINYDSRYWFTDEMDQPSLTHSFDYHSTGNYSQATEFYSAGGEPATAVESNFPSSFPTDYSDYTKPTGYGAGFDFGLVYLLSIGDDFSLARAGDDQVVNKSLRLGFSVTDIGFVAYSKNPFTMAQRPDTSVAPVSGTSDTRFEGSPGQYLSFFDRAGQNLNPLRQGNGEVGAQKSRFTALLPTSFNAGMLLQLNRLKLSADLTLGLNDTAFNNTKLIGHFGVEFSPIKTIPIRLGTQLASGYPLLWSAGTGVEMEHWEFSIGAQFLSHGNTPTLELGGAAFSGLKFHF